MPPGSSDSSTHPSTPAGPNTPTKSSPRPLSPPPSRLPSPRATSPRGASTPLPSLPANSESWRACSPLVLSPSVSMALLPTTTSSSGRNQCYVLSTPIPKQRLRRLPAQQRLPRRPRGQIYRRGRLSSPSLRARILSGGLPATSLTKTTSGTTTSTPGPTRTLPITELFNSTFLPFRREPTSHRPLLNSRGRPEPTLARGGPGLSASSMQQQMPGGPATLTPTYTMLQPSSRCTRPLTMAI